MVCTYLVVLSILFYWYIVCDYTNLSGWFARDPSILHRVGHILLQLNQVEPRRTRCFIIADDLFQLSKVPKQKSIQVITRVTENLSGCKSKIYHISVTIPWSFHWWFDVKILVCYKISAMSSYCSRPKHVACLCILSFGLIDSTDQPPRHVNFGQYVAANVPSLRGFREESMTLQDGISTLKALSSVMFLLQRYLKLIYSF